jgi:hypothetical protein
LQKIRAARARAGTILGACIWFAYVIKHHIPVDTLGDKTFGGLYETALRDAFFKIAARYPGEVLKTFFYYKPRYIPWSIAQDLRFNIEGDQQKALNPAGPKVIPYASLAVVLFAASLFVVLVYFGTATIGASEVLGLVGVTLLSALFTLPAYFAAWAMPHTSGDLLLYTLFLAGLALGACIVGIRAAMRRLFAPVSA